MPVTVRVAVAVVVLALSAAGCGSSSAPAGSPNASAGGSSPLARSLRGTTLGQVGATAPAPVFPTDGGAAGHQLPSPRATTPAPGANHLCTSPGVQCVDFAHAASWWGDRSTLYRGTRSGLREVAIVLGPHGTQEPPSYQSSLLLLYAPRQSDPLRATEKNQLITDGDFLVQEQLAPKEGGSEPLQNMDGYHQSYVDVKGSRVVETKLTPPVERSGVNIRKIAWIVPTNDSNHDVVEVSVVSGLDYVSDEAALQFANAMSGPRPESV